MPRPQEAGSRRRGGRGWWSSRARARPPPGVSALGPGGGEAGFRVESENFDYRNHKTGFWLIFYDVTFAANFLIEFPLIGPFGRSVIKVIIRWKWRWNDISRRSLLPEYVRKANSRIVLMMWGIFSRWSGALIMASTVCIFAGSTVLGSTYDFERWKIFCTCTTPAHLCPPGSLSGDGRGRPSTANSWCYQALFKKFLTDRHKALLKASRSKLFGVGGKADQVEISGLQKMSRLKDDLHKIFVNLI